MTHEFFMQNMYCYNNRFSSVSDVIGSMELTVQFLDYNLNPIEKRLSPKEAKQ